MRTRLDEIVDEAQGHAPSKTYWSRLAEIVFKEVAERAFRHGVEQAEEAYGYESRPNVQPAPAGEKECCDWVEGSHFHIKGTDRVAADRRKGERRKLRWLTSECDGRRVYFAPALHRLPGATWDGMLYAYFIDRRSGKDRRKG